MGVIQKNKSLYQAIQGLGAAPRLSGFNRNGDSKIENFIDNQKIA